PIPQARRIAVPGVRLCIACQEERDATEKATALYNRRGSKDSQLR
ncbi:MAG: TraR/DksA C4-type zinc finger protein, partial [Pseudomonadota bacterium]